MRSPPRPLATKGRKLSLPDSVFDRLQLTAIQRRKTVSAVAAEILDRNLPKLRIEREGKGRLLRLYGPPRRGRGARHVLGDLKRSSRFFTSSARRLSSSR
jgi:hypothetical protein